MKKNKFRAWDEENNNWLVTDDVLIDSSGSLWDLRKKPIGRFNNLSVENIIVQQFTGFTDKNGKEIYDGDRKSVV